MHQQHAAAARGRNVSAANAAADKHEPSGLVAASCGPKSCRMFKGPQRCLRLGVPALRCRTPRNPARV